MMEKTSVVNINNSPYQVYIGRPGKWGNPFIIGVHGNRNEVIEKYEKWIRKRPGLLADLGELKGKVLGCHCWPSRCHGDILIKLLEERDETDQHIP